MGPPGLASALSACCPTLSQLGQNRPSCPWLATYIASRAWHSQTSFGTVQRQTVAPPLAAREALAP